MLLHFYQLSPISAQLSDCRLHYTITLSSNLKNGRLFSLPNRPWCGLQAHFKVQVLFEPALAYPFLCFLFTLAVSWSIRNAFTCWTLFGIPLDACSLTLGPETMERISNPLCGFLLLRFLFNCLVFPICFPLRSPTETAIFYIFCIRSSKHSPAARFLSQPATPLENIFLSKKKKRQCRILYLVYFQFCLV